MAGTQKVPKKAPNDLYLSNVTPSVVCLDANKSGGGGGLLLLLLRRERERERAKGDAVLVVFSASTRWLWWKRTTGLIQTRRLCDFCWDYGRGNIPIHFSSSKSRRFKTALRRRRRKEQPRNDDSFFRPRRKKTRGKETLTIRFSWPPLGRKQ